MAQPTEDFEDDLALAKAAAAGRVEARHQLADRLLDQVRTTVSYLAPRADAEDLAQNALIQILRYAGSFSGKSSLEAWADRVAIRCVLKSYVKQKRRRLLAEEHWTEAPDSVADVLDAEDGVDRRRARRRLSAALQELSVPQSVALVLQYLHGYRVEEIAEIMGCRVNTVRGRLRNGKKKMREKILSDPVLLDWLERRR